MNDETGRSHTAPIDGLAVSQSDAAYDGVLTSRLIAYLADLFIIIVLSGILMVAIFILGFLTFGLGWLLFALVGPGTGIIYSALTVGGSRSATFGMRMMGLKVVQGGGRKPDWLSAAIHALLFYVAAGTLLVLVADVLIGFARRDRRLGHDLVTDFTLVNARDIVTIS